MLETAFDGEIEESGKHEACLFIFFSKEQELESNEVLFV